MVNKNEIRIGNWFEHSSDWSTVNQIESVGMQFQFDDIHFFYIHESLLQYEHLNPIPLSPEVLINCGFKQGQTVGFDTKVFYSTGAHRINFQIGSEGGWWMVHERTIHQSKSIDYLHELQNLYYAICREELNYTKP